MRIIGGSLSGRIFHPPLQNWPTRPTTDMAKEALYNILMNKIDFEDAVFLDLFGGTGVHTLEFLSRGCKNVTYVDRFAKCVRWIKQSVDDLGLSGNVQIIKSDVDAFLKATREDYSVIFADPPYDLSWLDQIPEKVYSGNLLVNDGLLIIEHSRNHSFQDHEHFVRERKYGQTRFSFFQKSE